MREVWSEIPEFVGLYWVSNLGQVKNRKGKVLKPINNGKGYFRVDLRGNGKRRQRLVHRIVAEAFVPNPENKPEVNHKNKVKSNCEATNLEWVTRIENEIHKRGADFERNKNS